MQLQINLELKKKFPTNLETFHYLMELKGEVFRKVAQRCTQRVALYSTHYFIKQHYGVGWKEIFKNLLQLRLPVLSAINEVHAIKRLQQLNIPTLEMVAFGIKGVNPARRQSFVLTRELPKFITLEDLVKQWKEKAPSFCFKYKLIKEIAHIARTLHLNGINHRDFYICHFLLDLIEYSKEQLKLYLIDLHRAQIRDRVPKRWVIKDLAGLYFSSKECGLTQRDLLRFIKLYRNERLRIILNKEDIFWRKVKNRGNKLYQKHTVYS